MLFVWGKGGQVTHVFGKELIPLVLDPTANFGLSLANVPANFLAASTKLFGL